jgi:hypothetical protein
MDPKLDRISKISILLHLKSTISLIANPKISALKSKDLREKLHSLNNKLRMKD